MHILFIPSWYPRNTADIRGSFFREQAQALSEYGCQVGVITLQLKTRSWRSVFKDKHEVVFENDGGVSTYQKHGVRWSYLIITWIWKTSIMKLFKQYIKHHGKPDIIHVHSILFAGIAAKAISEKYNIPYVLTEHSTAFSRGLVTPKQKCIVQQVAASAEKRFAVSQPFATLLFEFIEVKNNLWEVMPNIVHERFLNSVYKTKAKAVPFTFINISLLTEKKAVDLLIKAFSKVLVIQPGLRLKIGGEGCERSNLEELTRELGVVDSVEFLGLLTREQVAEQISLSDMFVLSSQYETFSVVIIEALALGKPVIATRCGGPEGFIREEDGFLIPINDVNAMADAMLSGYKRRVSFKDREIRSACYERFSGQVITQKLMLEYRNILSNNSK